MNKFGWIFALIVLGLFVWLAWYSYGQAKAMEAAYSQEAIHRVNDLAAGKVVKHKTHWTKEDTRAALIELGWGRE